MLRIAVCKDHLFFPDRVGKAAEQNGIPVFLEGCYNDSSSVQ